MILLCIEKLCKIIFQVKLRNWKIVCIALNAHMRVFCCFYICRYGDDDGDDDTYVDGGGGGDNDDESDDDDDDDNE